MRLGTCYYPEHWDEAMWASDADRMAGLGLSLARIGEFAWSRLEPEPGQYDFAWLDRAIETLAGAGLEVMLGTPTATPPRWMLDRHPDMLALDEEGRPRGFGSRRHYCFSHEGYREEAARITRALAERYGAHPAVTHWQTDNEFGCHGTVRSYSDAAAAAFRVWLEARYAEVGALNEAWGTVFWSQEYRSFSEVGLPNLTVTEPNPSQVLDFYRFSSDQVVSFHRAQAEIVNAYAPDAVVTHNVMGWFTDFDHRALGAHTDLLTWDSYPLGFLDQSDADPARKLAYMRQGDPDFAGFHHDLYRGCAPAFGVVEQQPGPVNWAPNNPAPLPGMLRLWGHEAAAHGARLFSPFRWRQYPKAQEQNHAGLLRADDAPAPAFAEVAALQGDAPQAAEGAARVALVFDYETVWMSEVQPQGAAWRYMDLVRAWYRAARKLALDVDVAAPGGDLSGYALVLTPSLFHVSAEAMAAFARTEARLLFGPRTGSKDENGNQVPGLAPGPLRSLLPLTVTLSESLPPAYEAQATGHAAGAWGGWLDHVETGLAPLAEGPAGEGLLYGQGKVSLLTTLPREDMLAALVRKEAEAAGLAAVPLPDGVRVSLRQGVCAVNYASEARTLPGALGGHTLAPGGVHREAP